MTEISSNPIPDFYEMRDEKTPSESRETPAWEKTGRLALIGFSLIGAGAFIPALGRKKRNVTSALPGFSFPLPVTAPNPVDITSSEPVAVPTNSSREPQPPLPPPILNEVLAPPPELPALFIQPPQAQIEPVIDWGLRYRELRCTPNDQHNIRKLTTTLAGGYFAAMRNAVVLNQIGLDVKPVHPFKFLSVIFTHAESKKAMGGIFKNGGMIKNRMVGGLKENRDHLIEYLPHFCQELNASEDLIKPLILSDDWEQLVIHLLS